MLELLFLLLPAAVAYGWIMGRNHARKQGIEHKVNLSTEYSAGLNFLLSDQEDKALTHLIDLLEVNAYTIETHLTLAKLFRRKGEFDKAIKIHQYLSTFSLDESLLGKIKFELAEDYIEAGFIDRAEPILLGLITLPHCQQAATLLLLKLFQQTREWHKALEIFPKSPHYEKIINHKLAHFCCELADLHPTDEWEEKALQYDALCIRAILFKANRSYQQQDYVQAKQLFIQIINLNPYFIPLVLNPLENCFQADNSDPDFKNYLETLIQQSDSVQLFIKQNYYLEQTSGLAQALYSIIEQLKKRPSVRAFVRLLELEIKASHELALIKRFENIKHLVVTYVQIKPSYECTQCGFESVEFYWHCPSCHEFSTIIPKKGVDGL